MISPNPVIRLPARAWPIPREARLALACILAVIAFGRPQQPAPAPAATDHTWFNQPEADSSHFYFGGRHVHGAGIPLQLGAQASTWASFLPFAAATPALAPSCLAAEPPAITGATPPKDIADDIPGLYGAPWVAAINGNLIAALHVTVPRHPSWQTASPVLQIYRKGETQPAFSQAVPGERHPGQQRPAVPHVRQRSDRLHRPGHPQWRRRRHCPCILSISRPNAMGVQR